MTAGPDAPSGAHLFDDLGGDRYVATEWSRGPWDPRHCHGAPTAALLVRAVERVDTSAVEWELARITIELTRPVPVGRELAVSTSLLRPGSRVSLVATRLIDTTTGVEVATATALRISRRDTPTPDVCRPDGEMPGGPDEGRAETPPFRTDDIAYATHSCDFRFVRGSWSERGPSAVWIRLRVPVVPGESPTGAQRAAAAADFGNGVSAPVEHLDWLYINPDLTIHLARRPVGEWIGLASLSHLGTAGAGLAESSLHDGAGRLGLSAQSLFVERR
ncbi:MAG: hypothetical protein RIR49_98 [Actinomycetota bacterium]